MAEAFSTPAPRERPILFSAPLVRAILAGTKSQTRRLVKNPGRLNGLMLAGEEPDWCPYGKPGDRLWVREAWIEGFPTGKRGQWTCLRPSDFNDSHGRPFYRADGGDPPEEAQRPWRPSIHMPRWASRITLEVSGVRVEQLHEITCEDVAAEGIRCRTHKKCAIGCAGRRYAFYDKWDELHGAGSAVENPWVWVIGFRKL